MRVTIKYKVFSVFCLAIMTCYVLRPVMPYMEYMINKGYIEKNLCVQKDVPENSCHGTCYLHKQIQKTQEEGKTDQNKERNENQNNKLDDHIAAGEIPPPPVETFINLLQIADFPLIQPFADPIFIPPKS